MSNSSWFGIAPRPSTPTRLIQRSYSNNSAPNSPLGLPRIERVPSQDALDRAIHNDSGHGKSTVQIIKELKASNAKLCEKTADMEADFMNQVNEMTSNFNLKEEALQKTLAAKEQQIATMESRITSTETRIRERDSQVAKLKEETTFQRHTIADLKNQLYQLQHEIEEAEYDKVDGVDKWSTERTEMERELEALRSQVKSLTEVNDGQKVMACWKQLDATKIELDGTKKRLDETQTALSTLEKEAKRVEKEALLKESELLAKIKALESGEMSVLKKELAEKDKAIASMSAEIADARARLQNEDKYRRQEADDLRVLNDSLLADIEHLKNDLDEMEREIEGKNEMLLDKNQELGELQADFERVDKELKLFKERASKSDQHVLQADDLSTQLQTVRIDYEALEDKLKATSETFEKQIKAYNKKIDDYEKKIDSLEKDVQDLIADRDDLEKKLESSEETQRKALQGHRDHPVQEESRAEQRLREIVASAAKERSDLEAAFEERLKNVELAYEKKVGQLAVNTNEKQELLLLRNETKQKAMELERLREQLRTSEVQISRQVENQTSSNEVLYLRNQVRVLEAKKTSTERTKKQLREAQIALVALDDEKNISDQKHSDKIKALESQISDLERDYQAQALRKDAELSQLRDKIASISEYEAEIKRLRADIKDKDALVNALKSNSALVSANGDVGDAVRKELLVAKRTEEKLLASLAQAREELASHQDKVREKLADRDTTISALVKSSVSQEQKMTSMKAEINALKTKLKSGVSVPAELEAVRKAREVEYIGEIEYLRSALDDCKDVENRLLHNLSSLERNLVVLEGENKRLRSGKVVPDSPFSRSVLLDHDEKLQERDSAIGNLVQQSMALEQQVDKLLSENASLRKEIENLRHGGKTNNGPSWAEIRRLQKESEIFAGQIIEQDEEMETLRLTISEREARIAEVERENSSLKRKASSITRENVRVDDLQAELDELQEANNTQRADLRDMRKQLREAMAKANEAQDLRAELEQAKYALEQLNSKAGTTAREDANLRRRLEIAQLEKDDIEKKLTSQIESMRRLRNSTVDSMEEKLKEKDAVITQLQSNDKVILLESEIKNLSKQLLEKAEELEVAQSSIKELQKIIDDKSTVDELAKKDREIATLVQEVSQLRKQLEELEADKKNIDATKERLVNANAEKEELETRIVDAYERKLSMLHYDTDVTIDSLRKELAEAKALNSEHNDEALKHIELLERENRDVKEELEAKLQLKNTKIQALEQTLGAQEQLVENMRAEMDQLQSNMERTSLSRRAEIEEMQQEMIDISSKAQRQEREITSLKMALEEVQLERSAEVARLKEQLSSVEKAHVIPEEVATKSKPRDTRLDDVKERLENMKWRNTTLQEENLKLRKRLEKLEGEFAASRTEQDKTFAAEEEVAALRKRVQQLEEMTALEPPPPPPLAAQGQTAKMAVGDNNGSRFGRIKKTTSSLPTQQVQSASPRGFSQPSPLRFLKRKQSKDVPSEEIPKNPTEDNSSTASKMTF